MRQELYKTMYQQICMGDEQKNRIWQKLEAEGRKANKAKTLPKRFPARAAACAGILLVSGMTVLAADEFSVMDRIADAMGYLTQNEQELTEEQKNIYARYGSALDNEISMTYGTLKLDAALYDKNYLFIPFHYIYDQDAVGYEELTAGTDIRKTGSWNGMGLAGYNLDMNSMNTCYRIEQDTRAVNSWIIQYDHIIEEDGVLSGSILLSVGLDKTFAKEDVIQLVRYEQKEGEPDEIRVLTEFSLGNPVEQHELAVDAETNRSLQDMGMTIESMSVSPVSLRYSGIGTHRDVSQAAVEVVLRDGSVVEESASGSSLDFECPASEKEYALYDAAILFAAPVLHEEIAGVRIKYKTQQVWIAAD